MIRVYYGVLFNFECMLIHIMSSVPLLSEYEESKLSLLSFQLVALASQKLSSTKNVKSANLRTRITKTVLGDEIYWVSFKIQIG